MHCLKSIHEICANTSADSGHSCRRVDYWKKREETIWITLIYQSASLVHNASSGEVEYRDLMIEWTEETVRIDGYRQPIELQCYIPTATEGPVLMFFHGGGFISGESEAARLLAGRLASESQLPVVCVRYSLSPQFPFPVALEDGYAALQWLARAGTAVLPAGGDPVLVGHDAGACLVTGLAAMARDRGGVPNAIAQVLIAPLLDPSLTMFDWSAGSSSYELLGRYSRNYKAYLPNPSSTMHPYAAPLESYRLGRLPRALIAVPEMDCLRREAEAYAGRLMSSGVHARLLRYGGCDHESILGEATLHNDIRRFIQSTHC
ncbi:alpha/beta hydrolase [Caballeronia grimmiae]|uniref:alpha/beta hydrolase n=1 Tax=Caballeronia grimmiae TaxID=1071679 RepID=UPI0009DDF806|nr:alpha/beta hydrolase [Caballeronia grimmiae]